MVKDTLAGAASLGSLGAPRLEPSQSSPSRVAQAKPVTKDIIAALLRGPLQSWQNDRQLQQPRRPADFHPSPAAGF